MILPSEGKTFADVVGAIRKEVRPEDSGTEVRRVRRTRDGGVLLEIERSRDSASLKQAISAAVGTSGVVRALTPRTKLEILDLDVCADDREVREAVTKAVGECRTGDLKISVFAPNARGERVAVVELDEAAATKILSQGRMKVGWVASRVRRRVEVTRCFRCLGFGHTRRECKGPDRSGNCWRCGEGGHNAKGCVAPPVCRACSQRSHPSDHVQGSGACRIFRDILSRMKGEHRRA